LHRARLVRRVAQRGRRDPLGNAETSAAVRAVIRALDRALPVRRHCLQARSSADHVTRQHDRRSVRLRLHGPGGVLAKITVEVRKLSANRAIAICASLALAMNHRHRRSTADLLQALQRPNTLNSGSTTFPSWPPSPARPTTMRLMVLRELPSRRESTLNYRSPPALKVKHGNI
jgi:hypothetical protein